jgi:hypothetical protein
MDLRNYKVITDKIKIISCYLLRFIDDLRVQYEYTQKEDKESTNASVENRPTF